MSQVDVRIQPGEKILRKTVEFIERPLVVRIPEPKVQGSRCYRKACHFMWFLWNHGYRKFILRETMLSYVQNFLGAFRTTINFWLGHKVYGGSRGSLYLKREQRSYLEKLCFIAPTPQGYELNHEFVPLPYHYREYLDFFQSPEESAKKPQDEFQHESSVAKVSMSLVSHTEVESAETKQGAAAPIEAAENNQQQHAVCERINTSKYTYTNKNSVESAPGPWLTEQEQAEILKRDRKRLEILDRELLPALEKSMKRQV